MAHDVFISYTTANKAVADAVCHHLEQARIRCWIAPRDIIPGESWPKAIPPAIAASRLVVLIFSSQVNQSEFVVKEITLAANAKKVILPFRIEESLAQGELEFLLVNTHWLNAMTRALDEHIHELVGVTRGLLAGTVAPPTKAGEVPFAYHLLRYADLGLTGLLYLTSAFLLLLAVGMTQREIYLLGALPALLGIALPVLRYRFRTLPLRARVLGKGLAGALGLGLAVVCYLMYL